MIDYHVVDVFTQTPFGGNQLAVIPDATALKEDQLQKIAREFNFSEVAFVYPPEDARHTAKVRLFTPTTEIPFAGHPTIGTAVVLAHLGKGPEMTLELGVGPLDCHATETEARFTTRVPFEVLGRPETGIVARALGLPIGSIKSKRHMPMICSLGLPFVVTEVQDRAALAACNIDFATFKAGVSAYPQSGDFAQYVYCQGDGCVHARMFAPLDIVPEDPATGSAAATLAGLTAHLDGEPVDLHIQQGEDMGRPSRIHAYADQGRVTVTGSVVRVMQGQLLV